MSDTFESYFHTYKINQKVLNRFSHFEELLMLILNIDVCIVPDLVDIVNLLSFIQVKTDISVWSSQQTPFNCVSELKWA